MFVNRYSLPLITVFGPFIFDMITDMVKFSTCHLAICIISVDFSSNLAREGIFLCSLQMRKAGSGVTYWDAGWTVRGMEPRKAQHARG